MNKDEILEKSRRENQPEDERDRQISQKACESAYRAVNGVNAFLILLLFLQKQLTGEAFVTWWPFALSIFISQSVHELIYYRYYRKTLYLVSGLIGLTVILLAIFIIVLKGFF